MTGTEASAASDSDVDDGSSGTSQLRQERLGHTVGSEEVDGEVLLEHRPIAEVVVQRQAGIVDEDVERLDLLDRRQGLRGVRHVKGQRV